MTPISDIVRPHSFRNYAASEQEGSVGYRHPWREAYCAILLKKFLQSFAHWSALRIRALRQGTAKNVRCPWKSSHESCGRISQHSNLRRIQGSPMLFSVHSKRAFYVYFSFRWDLATCKKKMQHVLWRLSFTFSNV